MTLDEKYLPTAIVLPFEGHSRQSKLMHAQVKTSLKQKNMTAKVFVKSIEGGT